MKNRLHTFFIQHLITGFIHAGCDKDQEAAMLELAHKGNFLNKRQRGTSLCDEADGWMLAFLLEVLRNEGKTCVKQGGEGHFFGYVRFFVADSRNLCHSFLEISDDIAA